MNPGEEHFKQDQLQAFMAGSLPAEEAAAVQEHLQVCENCRACARSDSRLDGALRRIPLEELDQAFTRRVLESLGLDRGVAKALRFFEILPHILGLALVLGTMLIVFTATGDIDVSGKAGDDRIAGEAIGRIAPFMTEVVHGGWRLVSAVLPTSVGSTTLSIVATMMGVIGLLAILDRGIGRRLLRKS